MQSPCLHSLIPTSFTPTVTHIHETPTKTIFAPKELGEGGSRPVHRSSESPHKPSSEPAVANASILGLKKKRCDLLVPQNAVVGVVNVLFGQLPVLKRSFHEAGDHDEAEDEDVDAGEHFVHQG